MTARPVRRSACLVVVALVTAILATACAGSGNRATGNAPAATVEPTQTFVAIGSGATVGDGLAQPLAQTWPRLVWLASFPRSTVFVNAAVEGATASSALHDQVPLVEELHASVVAVWLGSLEAFDRAPVTRFEANLLAVVRALRSSGARVYVGDLPRLGPVDLKAYNTAIARVVGRTGATLVPLHAVNVAVGTDNTSFFPNALGHRAIAAAFQKAIKR